MLSGLFLLLICVKYLKFNVFFYFNKSSKKGSVYFLGPIGLVNLLVCKAMGASSIGITGR